MKKFYCLVSILFSTCNIGTSLASEAPQTLMTTKEQNMFRRNLQVLLDTALEEGATFLSTLKQLEKSPTKYPHSTFNESYENIIAVAKQMEILCHSNTQAKEGAVWHAISEIAEEKILREDFLNEEEILNYMRSLRTLRDQEESHKELIEIVRNDFLNADTASDNIALVSEEAEAAAEVDSLSDLEDSQQEAVVLSTTILPAQSA